MDEFEKALDAYFFDKSRRGVKEDFQEGARWAFKWIDSRHLKAKWKLMQERDRLKRDYDQICENYGMQSQALADYDKRIKAELAENAKLRGALEKIVIKPVQDEDYMLVVEEYNPSKIAKQALAETGGDDGEETANQVLWDVLKWLDQGSLSEHDPLYKRIKSVLVEEQK